MLGKKLMVSVMGSGLLWAAGLAGHAVLTSHPGLLLVAGQIRLSLGDEEGGLRLMRQAAQQDQTAQPNQAADQARSSAPASAAPASPAPSKCAAKVVSNRLSARTFHPARLVTMKVEVPGPGYALTVARQQRDVVRLSLEQARLSENLRALVMQQVRDLPPVPAAPREPSRNTP